MELSIELIAGLGIGLVVGLIIGYVVVSLLDHRKISSLEAAHRDQEHAHREKVAELNGRLEQMATAQEIVDNAKEQLGLEFRATANEVLQNSNDQFLQLASENLGKTLESAKGEFHQRHLQFQELVKPLADNYSSLNPRVDQLNDRLQTMTAETANLAGALRGDNRAVGNWGEIQLRRVVELAGMTEYCDFSEQQTSENSLDRPDLVVNLPERRAIVVDAKASTAAYMDAGQSDDEETATAAWARHANALRTQVTSLSNKRYGDKIDGSLDFAVMFVPGDQFLAAALRSNPDLVEYAMSRRVAIATPASLIAMLWAVANGWQQQELARNAEEIRRIGTEMHDRLITFTNNYGTLRQRIAQTVTAFNTTVGTLEGSVMVSARRMAELRSVDTNQITQPEIISDKVRQLRYADDDSTMAA